MRNTLTTIVFAILSLTYGCKKNSTSQLQEGPGFSEFGANQRERTAVYGGPSGSGKSDVLENFKMHLKRELTELSWGQRYSPQVLDRTVDFVGIIFQSQLEPEIYRSNETGLLVEAFVGYDRQFREKILQEEVTKHQIEKSLLGRAMEISVNYFRAQLGVPLHNDCGYTEVSWKRTMPPPDGCDGLQTEGFRGRAPVSNALRGKKCALSNGLEGKCYIGQIAPMGNLCYEKSEPIERFGTCLPRFLIR